jgi:hypothetical protein
MDLATGLQHPDGPIGSDHPVLARKSGAGGSCPLDQLEHPLAIVGVEQPLEHVEAGVLLPGRQAEDTIQLLRPGHLVARKVPAPTPQPGQLLGLLEGGLARSDVGFGGPQRPHVHHQSAGAGEHQHNDQRCCHRNGDDVALALP